MLMKICQSCGQEIAQGQRCNCRDKIYDKAQRNEAKAAFYHSKMWRSVSNYARARANGLDEYELSEGRIRKGNIAHHIYTVEERPDLVMSVSNLVYVSSATHNMIHNEYDKGTSARKAMQEKLVAIRG